MTSVFRKLAPFVFLPLLTHCGSTTAPEPAAVTGPFDDKGNYMEDWVDQPDKWFKPDTPSEKKKSKFAIAKKEDPKPREIETFVPNPVSPIVTEEKPMPTVVKTTPKPTPKPKPKPKPKPVVVRHTVKKGDTLSGLASKYGSSVSKIKGANSISGSVIRLGQTLTIPK